MNKKECLNIIKQNDAIYQLRQIIDSWSIYSFTPPHSENVVGYSYVKGGTQYASYRPDQNIFYVDVLSLTHFNKLRISAGLAEDYLMNMGLGFVVDRDFGDWEYWYRTKKESWNIKQIK